MKEKFAFRFDEFKFEQGAFELRLPVNPERSNNTIPYPMEAGERETQVLLHEDGDEAPLVQDFDVGRDNVAEDELAGRAIVGGRNSRIDTEYADEILEVARKLGLDVSSPDDRRFIWVAEQVLINPLSNCTGWTEEEDDGGYVFYYHAETGESRWEPPSLSHFAGVLETLRFGLTSSASFSSPGKTHAVDVGVTWSPERFTALPGVSPERKRSKEQSGRRVIG